MDGYAAGRSSPVNEDTKNHDSGSLMEARPPAQLPCGYQTVHLIWPLSTRLPASLGAKSQIVRVSFVGWLSCLALGV